MNLRLIGSALLVIGLAAAAHAQQNGVAVQLPTLSAFSVETTVSVPDSGGAYAAAIKRARTARALSGLPIGPKQRAIGTSVQAAGVHVTATIHDQQEMDEDVLAQAEKKHPRQRDALSLRLLKAGDESAGQAALSVAEIRRRRATGKEPQDEEALEQLAHARAAAKAGKNNVARIYYQMASRRLKGQARADALAKAAALARPKQTVQVASSQNTPQRTEAGK